jgi:hypothetical protein
LLRGAVAIGAEEPPATATLAILREAEGGKADTLILRDVDADTAESITAGSRGVQVAAADPVGATATLHGVQIVESNTVTAASWALVTVVSIKYIHDVSVHMCMVCQCFNLPVPVH